MNVEVAGHTYRVPILDDNEKDDRFISAIFETFKDDVQSLDLMPDGQFYVTILSTNPIAVDGGRIGMIWHRVNDGLLI